MNLQQMIAVGVFLLVMAAIISEKVHRSVAALAGAVVLLLTHVLTIETAADYVDLNTIGVLVGMMLFVAVVKSSGLFEYIAIWSAKLTRGQPMAILAVFTVITAVLSAFLDNVTTVLLIGPMTIAITQILDVNPVPFLLSQIMASNIGGTATLIGDPPNIMIGSAAGLSFADFIVNTGPVVVIILAVVLGIFFLMYRGHPHPHDSDHAAGRHGRAAPVVGPVLGCLSGRQRQPHRCQRQRGSGRGQRQERISHHLHELPEKGLPLDAAVGGHLYRLSADSIRVMEREERL